MHYPTLSPGSAWTFLLMQMGPNTSLSPSTTLLGWVVAFSVHTFCIVTFSLCTQLYCLLFAINLHFFAFTLHSTCILLVFKMYSMTMLFEFNLHYFHIPFAFLLHTICILLLFDLHSCCIQCTCFLHWACILLAFKPFSMSSSCIQLAFFLHSLRQQCGTKDGTDVHKIK